MTGELETRTNNQIKDKQIVTTVSKATDSFIYFTDEKTKRTIQFIVTAQCGAISVNTEGSDGKMDFRLQASLITFLLLLLFRRPITLAVLEDVTLVTQEMDSNIDPKHSELN